jgi:hypothetical protein
MTRPASKTHVGYALIGCCTLVLICFALLPSGLLANDGLSYYGVHWVSVLPYISALALYAVALLYATRLLATQYAKPEVEKAGVLMNLCLALLAITPYSLSVPVHAAHDTFGSALFCTQLVVALWLATRRRSRGDLLLIALMVLAGVAAFFSLFDVWHLEVVGQLVYQFTFVGILWRYIEEPARARERSQTSNA